jgi:type VI secretion system protein ImpM
MAGLTPSVGLYGKHVAFGDFVTGGLPQDVQAVLEGWVHKMLPALRDLDEETWQARFDNAPEIRVWFGAGLIPGGFCGVIRSEQDKVGRRFPMIAGVSPGGQLPPMLDGGELLYDAIGEALDSFVRRTGDGAAEFAAHVLNMTAPVIALREDDSADFWAARPDGDLARLAGDIAITDHDRAAANRSYMWARGPGGVAIHAADKLQSADVINWLVTDAAAYPSIPEPQDALDDQDHIEPAAAPLPTL